MSDGDRFVQLRLPKRYEVLEREAKDQDYDITRIVQRVDSAASRIETLLRQVRDGGVGRFELFHGASGSGKTTFFRTLSRFFEGVQVNEISAGISLDDVADYIRQRQAEVFDRQVWVMHDRDNLEPSEREARQFFESLRVLFREKNGQVVVVWPITNGESADMLSEAAWSVGRDSIVDLKNKGIYSFVGLPKSSFKEVADLTTRNLNDGQSLESFGLTQSSIDPLLQEASTISEFYSLLEAESAEINDYYRDLLHEKTIPSVWILVGGDDSRELNLTVATLTQGIEKRVDIDRLISYLDNPDLDAAYLKAWKERRDQVAFLMRTLDVRIFELAPNVSLAAIRAHGSDEITEPLNLPSVGSSSATSSVSNAAFFKALIGSDPGRASVLRATEDATANEYRRVQVLARRKDKQMNRALSQAIQDALAEADVDAEVRTEKEAPDSNLKPDILITLADGSVFCIEPTWRSTGEEIEGEQPSRQNTLTVGHIQKYLLEKVMEYVRDLGM